MRLRDVALGLMAGGLLLSGCGGSGSTAGVGSGTSGPSAPTGSATVSWAAPTTNTDGTALTDLSGFHIHYGTSVSSLTQEADVAGPAAVSFTVTGLVSGTWFFAVSAYTNSGVESGLSVIRSKTIS